MPRIAKTIIFLFFLTNVLGQTQKPKLKITHLTGDFYVYTTFKSFKGNPFPANGLYVVTQDGAVMIDTPWDETQFQPLLDSIKKRHNKDVVICIATHSHEDRTGGLEYYRQHKIKTYTTKKTDSISMAKGEKRAEFLISKDTVFSVGQHKFQTYYGGKGHTPDNIVIWFDNEKILYGGCLIKSTEANDLGNLADANVTEWKTTLENIKTKFRKPRYIVPGHQKWTSKKSINHTLKLIKRYEEKY